MTILHLWYFSSFPLRCLYINYYIINLMFGKINFPGKRLDKINKQKKQIVQKAKIITKPQKSIKQKKMSSKNATQARSSLKGSKFRVLNELLYTQPSQKALQYFKQHEQDFDLYHQGFREQATKWSQNPLHSILSYLKKHYNDKTKLILDLGCGQGQLQQVMQKFTNVRSFDLVAKKQYVEIADISNLPVQDKSADACVFCLSLMGVNYIDFLMQAKRVLKPNGELLIAEVQSRCRQWNNFISMIQSLGFQCKANKTNNYFRLIYFNENMQNKTKLKIDNEIKNIKQYSQQILNSCLYKKR